MGKDLANQWILFAILGILAAVVIIVDLCLLIAWALRKSAVDAGLAPPLFAPRWSLVDVWLVGQVSFVVSQILVPIGLSVVLAIAMLVLGRSPLASMAAGKPPEVFMIAIVGSALLAQNVLFVAIPAWLIVRRYGTGLRQIGIRLVPTSRDVGWGVLGGIGILVISWLIQSAVTMTLNMTVGPQIVKKLEDITRSLTINSVMEGGMDWPTFLMLLLGGAVLAPIGEEFFFRGFLYNGAKRRFGIIAAMGISAFCFALVHMGPLAILPIFTMGLALAAMYEWRRSLWVNIIMHAFNNGTALIATFAIARMHH